MKVLLCAIFISLATFTSCVVKRESLQTVYVSDNGTTTQGCGTSTNPCRYISQVSKHNSDERFSRFSDQLNVEKGVALAADGGTVYVGAGRYGGPNDTLIHIRKHVRYENAVKLPRRTI